MERARKMTSSIDEYIALYPPDVQEKLKKLRAFIKDLVPEAGETISYGIPTFDLHGHLVHFAAFRDHISFFPTASGVAAFQQELSEYKISKGTIQFPMDKPMPFDLIKRIVEFRVAENMKKAKMNKKNK